MDRALRETIGFYRARAAAYDEGAERQAKWATLSDAVGSLAAVDLGASVLEQGAGTGFWTALLAQRVPVVTAVDAAPEALEVNRRRLADVTDAVEFASELDTRKETEIRTAGEEREFLRAPGRRGSFNPPSARRASLLK